MFDRELRVLAVLALGLFALDVSVAQDSPMSPDEIKQAWVDKKVFSRGSTGAFFDFYLRSNGSAEVVGNSGSDSGTWRLSDTGYCTTWKKIRAGTERCFTVVKKGSSLIVFNPDLSVAAEVLKVVE
jgi:uncharacterized membrane protein